MTATTKLGSAARAAMRMPVGGHKRQKVLVLIAAYIDAGRDDPSIRELAERAKLHRVAVVAVVDRLECDGWLRVQRAAGRRNRYSLSEGTLR